MTTHRFWQRIYSEIEAEQERVIEARKVELHLRHGFDGIAVMTDSLAVHWQHLDRVMSHAGCHGFAAGDRARGMKSARCIVGIRTYGYPRTKGET